jgi:hypothetical protein
MQDIEFELFRRLFENRDPELMEILNEGDDSPVAAFQDQPSTPCQPVGFGAFGFLLQNTSVSDTKRSVIDQLQQMMDDNCNEGEIMQELEKLCGKQGVAKILQLLIRQIGLESLEGNDDLWEMSAQQPQYHIEIRENKDFQNGVDGVCQIVMCDHKDHKEQVIRFTSGLQKAIYIWMLLHPRQAMTRAQINKGLKHQIAGSNGKLVSFYEMLYGVESKEVTAEDFTQLFAHIKRALNTTWKNLNSKGDLKWYTIERCPDNLAKVTPDAKNEDVHHYYINLPSNYITIIEERNRSYSYSIDNTREGDFRMPEGTYPPIENYPNPDN